MAAQARIDIDWEAIQREYRAGLLSVREIAARHNVNHALIIRRAKRYPNQWQRDLTKRVRKAVERKIVAKVTDDIITTEGQEEAIIEAASNFVMEVVDSHRRDLLVTRSLEQKLFTRISTDKDMTTGTMATAFNAYVSAQEKRIRMQRQAHGLTETANPGGNIIDGVRLIFDGDDL
jgi:hypothetical protein